MRFEEARSYIESLGYVIVAQLLHPGDMVSYDARKSRERLVRGPVASDPTEAMRGLMRSVMERETADFPWEPV